MVRSLTGDMLAFTQAEQAVPIILVQIDTDIGSTYFWNGVGDLTTYGLTFTGVGNMLMMTPVSETTQVQASGVSFTLSGLSADMVQLAMTNVRRNKICKAWVAALDENFEVIADPYRFLSGRVDSCSATLGGDSGTVTVSAEGRLIGLRRARERRFTDQDQRIESPTDAGFINVATLQDIVVDWNKR